MVFGGLLTQRLTGVYADDSTFSAAKPAANPRGDKHQTRIWMWLNMRPQLGQPEPKNNTNMQNMQSSEGV